MTGPPKKNIPSKHRNSGGIRLDAYKEYVTPKSEAK